MDNYTLDEYDKRVWRNKYFKYLFLEQSFGWSNTLTILDETTSRSVALIVELDKLDLTEWEPMSKEIYNKVVGSFKEGYPEEDNSNN